MTERDTDSRNPRPSFDPRFPPAFQPGYDARVHRQEPPKIVAREQPHREIPAVRPEPVPAHVAQPGQAAVADSSEASREQTDEQPDAAEHESIVWWRRVNPYLVGLAVLGVAFIAAAILIALEVANPVFLGGQTGPAQMLLFQFSFGGVPLLFVLGLATLTSVPAILALRWRARL